jgi:hypothetical protein
MTENRFTRHRELVTRARSGIALSHNGLTSQSAKRSDAVRSDPSALPPDEPPPDSTFAWQARVASP